MEVIDLSKEDIVTASGDPPVKDCTCNIGVGYGGGGVGVGTGGAH